MLGLLIFIIVHFKFSSKRQCSWLLFIVSCPKVKISKWDVTFMKNIYKISCLYKGSINQPKNPNVGHCS